MRKASSIAVAVITGIAAAALLSSRADCADLSAGAASLMADRCAVCHGENGDGQGPAASNLNPPPQNFHDRKWQKSVNDETLTKAIMLGGPAVGLSASMPGNPDLINQPGVVAAIVTQIRAWGK